MNKCVNRECRKLRQIQLNKHPVPTVPCRHEFQDGIPFRCTRFEPAGDKNTVKEEE